MKTPTRKRLVESSIRRCYRDGFRNAGLDKILTDVGISKTAFYKHFECKGDLMLAALEMQNRWLQDTFHIMIRERGGPSAIGQLHAVFDVVELVIESHLSRQQQRRARTAGVPGKCNFRPRTVDIQKLMWPAHKKTADCSAVGCSEFTFGETA